MELRFAPEIDHMNFRELPSGTEFGEVHTRVNPPLLVTDERGQAVFDDYFEVTENKLLTRVPLMPSMLTLNHTNIRQDCLCYLMERYRMTHSRILSRNGERD